MKLRVRRKLQQLEFLPGPASIRAGLGRAMAGASSMDIATAFVGRDWSDVLGTFNGKVRLVCWLTSTNTNPYAVEQMIQRGVKVRLLDGMHAKVYLALGHRPVAVVGSANLSGPALAADDAWGQCEAAVMVREPARVAEVKKWFDEIWTGRALRVTSRALEGAKSAWEAAHRGGGRKSTGKRTRGRARRTGPVSFLPPRWTPPSRLLRLASSVRRLDLQALFRDDTRYLARLDERGVRRRDLGEIIERLSYWTGHAGAYYPSLSQSDRTIGRAFEALFDRTRPVSDRLRDLEPGGSRKLPGFGLPAWTILLSWRYPAEYAPFDRRTKRFLQDFGLDRQLRTTLSARQYGEWIALAQELSARLKLPSTGHVDRLVWKHTGDLEL